MVPFGERCGAAMGRTDACPALLQITISIGSWSIGLASHVSRKSFCLPNWWVLMEHGSTCPFGCPEAVSGLLLCLAGGRPKLGPEASLRSPFHGGTALVALRLHRLPSSIFPSMHSISSESILWQPSLVEWLLHLCKCLLLHWDAAGAQDPCAFCFGPVQKKMLSQRKRVGHVKNTKKLLVVSKSDITFVCTCQNVRSL